MAAPPYAANTDEQRPGHFPNQQNTGQQDAPKGQHRAHTHRAHFPGEDGVPEGIDGHHGGGVSHDQVGILQTNKQDE